MLYCLPQELCNKDAVFYWLPQVLLFAAVDEKFVLDDVRQRLNLLVLKML
jgi:hypothetical protein